MIPSFQAKLYAHAFLNSHYKKDVRAIPYAAYQKWLEYLKKSKKRLFLLSMSSLQKDLRTELIDQIIIQFKLSTAEKSLITLLIARSDLTLLPQIIMYSLSLWEKTENQEVWKITSAYELSIEEKEKIILHLSKQTKSNIIPSFIINKALYGGFTLQSKKYFFDYSLNAFLKTVNHFIKNQE